MTKEEFIDSFVVNFLAKSASDEIQLIRHHGAEFRNDPSWADFLESSTEDAVFLAHIAWIAKNRVDTNLIEQVIDVKR